MRLNDRDVEEVLVVIVGAGASLDCLPDYTGGAERVTAEGLPSQPWKLAGPPLTKDLADSTPFRNSLVSRYRWCRPVIDDLRRTLGPGAFADQATTLERVLAGYRDRNLENPAAFSHINAMRFYLRDLLWACTDYAMSDDATGGVTNHLRLVSALSEWAVGARAHVCFVSFNYDLLLEHACGSYWPDFTYQTPHELIAHPYVSIVKPHGSVNWGWPLKARLDSEYGHSKEPASADNIALTVESDDFVDTRRIEVIRRAPHLPMHNSRIPLIPAVALPIENKTEFAWPVEHGNWFAALQGQVGRLITIGWRAAEDHFLDLLRPLVRAGASRLLVMPSDVEFELARERIDAATDAPGPTWRGATFSEVLKRPELQRFLLKTAGR